MKKLQKTLILTGISTFMLCTTAFASENDIATNGNQTQIETNLTEVQTENEVQAVTEVLTENSQEEIQTEEEISQGYVTADILNVRSGPSTDYEIVGKLSIGNTVNILSEKDGWCEIEFNSNISYVSSDYVNIVDTDYVTQLNISNQIVEYAKTLIGVPYAYGGESPNGFDCSGFTKYVLSNFGVDMPRSSHDQYSIGVRVDKSQLMPGDLVFFKYYSSSYRINHVGIYVGDGNFIHSPIPGQTVRIDSLVSGYFANYYYGATRVFY